MGEGKIVTLHSYRGGTGKSNLSANIAACAMDMGKRIAVLDSDMQSPGVHLLFGLDRDRIRLTLYDFLNEKCSIDETAYDVSAQINPNSSGKCWLVPASLSTKAITRILDEGYDVPRLNAHFDELLDKLNLDYLFIDTHPGLNKETMLSAAISDILVIVLRPDQQDYLGTAVLTDIADKLEVPSVLIILNKVVKRLDPVSLKKQMEETFGHEVIGVLPLCEDFAALASEGLFVQRYPDHEISSCIRDITQHILST